MSHLTIKPTHGHFKLLQRLQITGRTAVFGKANLIYTVFPKLLKIVTLIKKTKRQNKHITRYLIF